MKPGAITRLEASTVDAAPRSEATPTAAIRSPAIATSPRYHGAPVPSTIRPFVITTSYRDGACAAASAAIAPPAAARRNENITRCYQIAYGKAVAVSSNRDAIA